MASEVRVNPQLTRMLRKLPEDVRSDLTEGYKEAAEELRFEIMSRAPQDTGDMAASVGIRMGPKGKWVQVGPGLAGPRKSRTWHQLKAKWIEFGTAPHKIKAKIRKVLGTDTDIFGKEVMNPGMPPRPFLKPALEAARPHIRERLREVVKQTVRKANAKRAS